MNISIRNEERKIPEQTNDLSELIKEKDEREINSKHNKRAGAPSLSIN